MIKISASEQFISDLNKLYNDFVSRVIIGVGRRWVEINFIQDSTSKINAKLILNENLKPDMEIDFSLPASRRSEWRKLQYLPSRENVVLISKKIETFYAKLFEHMKEENEADFNDRFRHHFKEAKHDQILGLFKFSRIYCQLDLLIQLELCQKKVYEKDKNNIESKNAQTLLKHAILTKDMGPEEEIFYFYPANSEMYKLPEEINSLVSGYPKQRKTK